MALRDPSLQILNLMPGGWYLSVAAKYVNLVTIIQLGKLLPFALDKLLVMPKTRVKPPILLPRSPNSPAGFSPGGCGFLVAGLDEERRPYLRAFFSVGWGESARVSLHCPGTSASVDLTAATAPAVTLVKVKHIS